MDEKHEQLPVTQVCPQCGAGFRCEVAVHLGNGESLAEDLHCWCFDLPSVMPVRSDTACVCPACLRKAIREELLQRTLKEKKL